MYTLYKVSQKWYNNAIQRYLVVFTMILYVSGKRKRMQDGVVALSVLCEQEESVGYFMCVGIDMCFITHLCLDYMFTLS